VYYIDVQQKLQYLK